MGSKSISRRLAKGPMKFPGAWARLGMVDRFVMNVGGNTFKILGNGYEMAVRHNDNVCLRVYAFPRLTWPTRQSGSRHTSPRQTSGEKLRLGVLPNKPRTVPLDPSSGTSCTSTPPRPRHKVLFPGPGPDFTEENGCLREAMHLTLSTTVKQGTELHAWVSTGEAPSSSLPTRHAQGCQ